MQGIQHATFFPRTFSLFIRVGFQFLSRFGLSENESPLLAFPQAQSRQVLWALLSLQMPWQALGI